MARIRTIKPDFFKNEDVAEMPAMTRLLFIGLWTQSDREGRLLDRPKRLKAEIFPYDNYDVNKGLDELQKRGFIIRYKGDVNVQDRVSPPEQPDEQLSIIQIVNFSKHQQPNVKESASTLPAPYKHSASTVQASQERKGKEREQEGKGVLRAHENESPEDSTKDQSEANAPPVAPPPPPRQNKGPCIEAVTEFFTRAGGTEEMAKGFWNKWESVDWMNGVSAIRNWTPLANNYIATWHRNDEKDQKHGPGRKQTVTSSIEAIDAATADIIRDLDEAARIQHES